MRLTPSEVSLAAASISAVSLIVAVHIASSTRRQAREDRLWRERSSAYVDLLAWCIRQREIVKIRPDEGSAVLDEIVLPTHEEQIRLEARVSAFASDAVDAKVDEVTPHWNRLRAAWGDLQALHEAATDGPALRDSFGGIGQPEERWASAAEEVERWSKELIDLVRRELQSLRRMRR
jgi:hypothetical protein